MYNQYNLQCYHIPDSNFMIHGDNDHSSDILWSFNVFFLADMIRKWQV